MGALKAALLQIFPDEQAIVDLWTGTIRESSAKDYETKFKIFMQFLKSHNIPLHTLKLVHVLKFLMSLFLKGKATRTIYAYRSAIAQPLEWCFGIELDSQHIRNLLKGMALRRPDNPPKTVQWNISDVLEFIEEMPLGTEELPLLQTTAILLLLATGWRISELSACVRQQEYLHFTTEGHLKIRPHKTFLAKNEAPTRRWDHTTIRPLFLENGRRSKLCPILHLQEYLRASKNDLVGPLFKKPGTTDELPIRTLARYVCNFIRKASPRSKVSVHDIRKMASSIALVKCMKLSLVTSAMRWSSTSTFINFYLNQTSLPSSHFVTPEQNQI